MLMEAACDSPAKVAAAEADALYEALDRANASGRFFKGKIGLRDVKRMIQTAAAILE